MYLRYRAFLEGEIARLCDEGYLLFLQNAGNNSARDDLEHFEPEACLIGI